MKTLEQINSEIAELEKQLANVEGTKTEVYTRIVGYYRPVKAYNEGQAAQRKNRKNFVVPSMDRMEGIK